jgi:condensin-2 complex subunit H2
LSSSAFNGLGSSFGKTFEEICRNHIQAFAKSAEKFALTTKLTERISQWQAHLMPILEEEERKASFDIHLYSEMLLESAIETRQENKRKSMDGSNENNKQQFENSNGNPNIVEFKSVADGCTQSDICRFFLASLSLANSGNLKIEEGSPEYRFEILSSKVDKPMESYRAPSAAAVGGS